MKKRGIFFSIDAIIALSIIIAVLIVAYPVITSYPKQAKIHSDAISVLSSLKLSEINDSAINLMIQNNEIENPNKTILEQIGEFYVKNKTKSKEFAKHIFSYFNTSENIGIWFGENLIYSKNKTPMDPAENIEIDRQIISGIDLGNSTTGFSVRTYLASDKQTKFFYFGGYIGDGNISTYANFEGNITSAEMELAIDEEFELYINNIFSGKFNSSDSEYAPKKYEIPIENFQSGENLIEIKGSNIFIGGGYLKITYEGSPDETKNDYYFPGIDGIINIYDGIYFSDLKSMNINLHLKTNYTAFLKIGDTIVFESPTNGEETISIDNTQLSSILDYSSISNKTIPIRLGLRNVSYTINRTLNADAFSVTDLSGSMQDGCSGYSGWCCWWTNCGTPSGCSSCGGTWEEKLSLAKQANYNFINGILNFTGNRVGLTGYRSGASDSDYHSLSENNESLISEVESWTASGSTCICCGINKAKQGILSDSSPSKLRTMVVMSDGEANYQCAEQGTGSAIQDSIQAACDAYQQEGITVHAVGFGSGADESTLQQIAACGNGTYYYANVDEIVELYETIANDIIKATYTEQTVNASEEFENTILYPDSKIEYETSENPEYFGLILTIEKQFYNNLYGNFSIPSNSSIISAKTISYSGSRWTDNVKINNETIFKISEYGNEYTELGDPYHITIPKEKIQDENTIELRTALSPSNSTAGSSHNKIIYKIIKNSSSYSSISPYNEGCIWEIEFEDNTHETITIPSNYSGPNNCIYNSTKKEYDPNDAMQEAVFNLMKILDLNSNGKIETKFTEQNLEIIPNEITGIPYTWATEMQIRIWH